MQSIQKYEANAKLPPNDAATATEPATDPAALATAANPPAPITGTRVPNVGARAPKPAAIAGAAKPEEETDRIKFSISTCHPSNGLAYKEHKRVSLKLGQYLR